MAAHTVSMSLSGTKVRVRGICRKGEAGAEGRSRRRGGYWRATPTSAFTKMAPRAVGIMTFQPMFMS